MIVCAETVSNPPIFIISICAEVKQRGFAIALNDIIVEGVIVYGEIHIVECKRAACLYDKGI